jgi:3',5'-cyclic AMP phosphodiesterase CpdA/CheY-like chemotaxis protein
MAQADTVGIEKDVPEMSAPMSGQKAALLIIDDQENWRELIVAMLGGIFNCDVAATFTAAIDKVTSGNYRAIITNWCFPSRYDGFRLLSFLKVNHPDIPIVLVSGEFGGDFEGAVEEANNIKARYPSIKKIVMKGREPKLDSKFVADLSEIVFGMAANQPSFNRASTVAEQISAGRETESQRETTTVIEAGPRTLSWLHLSDLHLGSRPYEQEKVLKQLLEDVDEAHWNPDFIVVTGDIAASAQQEQYEFAGEFFDALLAGTGLSKKSLFVVPGNHDVDWSKLGRFRDQGIAAEFAKSHKVNDFFRNTDFRDERIGVFTKFENYARFINTYFVDENGASIRPFSADDYYFTTLLETRSGKVAVLGLNTAWASAFQFDFERKTPNDKEHLLLGELQVDVALGRVKDFKADLVIALMHHPFDWLEQFDRQWVEDALRQKCHFILHGHLHEITVAHQISPGADVAILGAGTTYEHRDHKNGYSFVSLDLQSDTGVIHLRRYSPERGGGWVPDTLSYPNARSNKIEIDIPKKLRRKANV